MKDLLQTMLDIQELQLIGQKKPERNPTLAALRLKVPAPILAHLDRLLNRGKKGIALVRGSVCAECHMRVPIGTMVTLMQGKDIQLCSSCGRYLCLPEEERLQSSPPPAPPAKPKRKKRGSTESSEAP